jgi:hypothetical protein
MRRGLGWRLLAGVLVAAALGTSRGAAAEPFAGTCDVRFVATSTLHDVEGTAPAVAFRVEPAAHAGRFDAWVVVPAATLSSGLAARDTNMWAMLEVERWPLIRGAFREVDLEAVAATGVLPLTLTIRDVSHELSASVTHFERTTERVSFDAEFSVSLAGFALTAPSVLGLIRVGDVVSVRTHAVLALSRPPA